MPLSVYKRLPRMLWQRKWQEENFSVQLKRARGGRRRAGGEKGSGRNLGLGPKGRSTKTVGRFTSFGTIRSAATWAERGAAAAGRHDTSGRVGSKEPRALLFTWPPERGTYLGWNASQHIVSFLLETR